MKRSCDYIVDPEPLPSLKQKLVGSDNSSDQIFSIARIDRNGTVGSMTEIKPGDQSPDLINLRCEKVRVGVSSKVNFSKLTPNEQRLRFLNQAEEIRHLRKKLHKYSAAKGKKEDSALQKAMERVKSAKCELEDQRLLVENLLKAINTGKLVPNTLAYNQICTILRDVLPVPCPQSAFALKLPEKSIPISKVEYDEYSKLPCTPAVLRALVGREQQSAEDPSELLRALHIQVFASIARSKGLHA